MLLYFGGTGKGGGGGGGTGGMGKVGGVLVHCEFSYVHNVALSLLCACVCMYVCIILSHILYIVHVTIVVY